MAILDPVKNFAKTNLDTAGISSVDTTMLVSTGTASLFPDPSVDGAFNGVIYNSTDYTNPSDDPSVEIVRVTGLTGDTFTITRGQEGTSASDHNTAGKVYTFANILTKKMIDDIRTALLTAGGGGGGFTFVDTNAFSGTSPTSFTDLDLSSIIGAKKSIVMLRVSEPSGQVTALTFKTKGETASYNPANGLSVGLSQLYLNSGGADDTSTTFVKTDENGVIQWYGIDARTVTIDVIAYSGVSDGTIISATAGQDLVAGNPVGVSFLEDDTVAIANTTYLEQALGFSPDITDTIQIDTDKIAILYGDGGTNLYVIVGTLDRASMTFTFGTPALVDADLGSTNSIHKLDTNKFAVLYNTTSTEKQVRLVGATVATNTVTLGTSVLLFTSADTIQDGIHSIQNGTDRGVMFTVDNSLNQKVIAYTFSGTTPTAGSAVSVDINNGGSGIGTKFRIALIASDKFVVSSWNKANVCTVSTNTITAGTGVAFTTNSASGSIWCWKIFSPATDVFIVGVNESNNRNLYIATVSGTVPTFGSLYALGSEQQMFGLSSTEVLLDGTNKLTISGTAVVSNTQIYQYTLTGQQVDMKNGTWWGITASGSNLQYFVQGMSQNFIGIIQSNVSLGGTASILIKGKDANQSGLIAGNLYSFSGTSLSLNNSGNVRALSATEVII